MNNTTATETTDLIEQQKVAALKLWSNLQILRSSAMPSRRRAASRTGTAFVNRGTRGRSRIFRKNQGLLQSARMLHLWFNPLWTNIDIRPVTFDKDNPYGITHLLISPGTSQPSAIQNEIENQIKAYQFIRNYALALDKRELDHIRRYYDLCPAYRLRVARCLPVRPQAVLQTDAKEDISAVRRRIARATTSQPSRVLSLDCSARCFPRTWCCRRLPWRSSSATASRRSFPVLTT